ncbi:MAG: 30S ribosomal protein S3 [Thermoplasmata archaeon]|nr:MAG: 30S ribosomal protein S3 [Thermoplasmata archaeon]
MAAERKFVKENLRRVLLKEYLLKETERAGFGGLNIVRTPLGTSISLIVERPGMVIGRKGQFIKKLTHEVESRFKFENPQIDVQQDRNPNLNPMIMAQKLANALERGWHYRRAGHSTLRRIMDAGAKGCLIIVAGKLTGQRHRTEKFKAGHIKFCGEPAEKHILRGRAIAKKKLGVIGVTIIIMPPDARLPDEVTLKDVTLEDLAEKGVLPEETIEELRKAGVLKEKAETPEGEEGEPERKEEETGKEEVSVGGEEGEKDAGAKPSEEAVESSGKGKEDSPKDSDQDSKAGVDENTTSPSEGEKVEEVKDDGTSESG